MNNAEPVTPGGLIESKERGEKIAVLTAYDAPTARILDEAGVDALLVGDSVGMAVLGRETTLSVTLDEMIHHARAVARGSRRALRIVDMPFLSYQVSPAQAVASAGRLVKEGAAQAVKLEGGEAVAPAVETMVEAGIPVMGHLGLTPQHVLRFGGYRVQARDDDDAQRLRADARRLQDAGAFSIVLECVPAPLAAGVSADLRIPVIGIGAGAGCDGQVLVVHDMLGLSGEFRPRFARRYAELGDAVRGAVGEYVADVRAGRFPAPSESFGADE